MAKLAATENRLAAELTSRNSGTGPKYKWNSPLHCRECFINDKDQCYNRDQKVFLVAHAEKIFRGVDDQLLVKLTFIYDLLQEFMNLT